MLHNIEAALKEHIRFAFADEVELAEAIEEVSNRKSQIFEQFEKAIKHYKSLEQESNLNSEKAIKDVFDRHFGSKNRPKSLDDLTLDNYIKLLVHKNKREYCQDTFNSLDYKAVENLLVSVRDIRNALFHFRREILLEDHKKLRFCSDWLARHPALMSESYRNNIQEQSEEQTIVAQESKQSGISDVSPNATDPEFSSVERSLNQNEGRYVRLAEELKKSSQASVTYTFKEIEVIIDDKLPKAAREDRSWWSNDESQPWVNRGWYVLSSNMIEEAVTFVRKPHAKEYKEFFQKLLGELSEKAQFRVRFPYQDGRHYITVATVPDGGTIVANLTYSFNENYKSFRVELFIDKSDWTKNEEIFDCLKQNQEKIESVVGHKLMWERLEHRPQSRISLPYNDEIVITDSEDKLKNLKEWAVNTMIGFQKVMDEYVSKC